MQFGPTVAVRQLPNVVTFSSPPRRASDILADIIIDAGRLTRREEANELAESWEDRFLVAAKLEHNRLIEEGRQPLYDFNSSSAYMIQGAGFAEPGDPPDLVSSKKKRSSYVDYLQIFEELKPNEFEWICGGILELLKVEAPVVTRMSADEGIDFYGKLSLEEFLGTSVLPMPIERNLNIWMIGQAKHFKKSQVSTKDIRELVGSVMLARAKAFGGEVSPLEGLELKICDPVFYLFFTTGRLSSNSYKLLRRSGVVGMDGEMIAMLLADHSVGIQGGDVDRRKFDEWLKKFNHKKS